MHCTRAGVVRVCNTVNDVKPLSQVYTTIEWRKDAEKKTTHGIMSDEDMARIIVRTNWNIKSNRRFFLFVFCCYCLIILALSVTYISFVVGFVVHFHVLDFSILRAWWAYCAFANNSSRNNNNHSNKTATTTRNKKA